MDTVEDTGPDNWTDPRVRILELDGTGFGRESFTFDEGAPLDDLDWAMRRGVGCWDSATTTPFFEGEHVFFGLDGEFEGWQEVTVTVTPEARAEANLYVLEQAAGRFDVPPEINAALYCHTTGRLGNPDRPVSISPKSSMMNSILDNIASATIEAFQLRESVLVAKRSAAKRVS